MIAILGGRGFVGSHVRELLINHNLPHILLEMDLVRLGTSRSRLLERIPSEVTHVVQCSWANTNRGLGLWNDEHFFWADISGNLAAASSARGFKLIALGSGAEFASGEIFASPYAQAKRLACEMLSSTLDLESYVWLRLGYVFSYAVGRPRILADARARWIAGVPFEPKTPSTLHNFMHVEDVAEAILAAISPSISGCITLHAPHVHSVDALLQAYNPLSSKLQECHNSEDVSWPTLSSFMETRQTFGCPLFETTRV